MREELYNELCEIEHRIYDILEETGGVLNPKNSDLGNAWCIIYDYLYGVRNKHEDQAQAQCLKKGEYYVRGMCRILWK